MEFSLFSLIAYATCVIDLPSTATEAECANPGGVFEYEDPADVPENPRPTDIRRCKEHPAGSSRPNIKEENLFEKRACYYGEPKYGCSKGYCWSVCKQPRVAGIGPWCWTAHNYGKGDWVKCSKGSDCKGWTNEYTSDKWCGKGSCKDCGCNCHF